MAAISQFKASAATQERDSDDGSQADGYLQHHRWPQLSHYSNRQLQDENIRAELRTPATYGTCPRGNVTYFAMLTPMASSQETWKKRRRLGFSICEQWTSLGCVACRLRLKDYKSQGELTLHRLSSPIVFTCGRCNKEKKAKFIATYRGQWDDLRCNGCYGQLLSNA